MDDVVEGVGCAVGDDIALALQGLGIDKFEEHVLVDLCLRQADGDAAHLLRDRQNHEFFPAPCCLIERHSLSRHVDDDVVKLQTVESPVVGIVLG